MPRLTVLMPVYNGERFLREAIDSILGQTFTDFEFLIVDDGSTDQTPALLRAYGDPRIVVLRHSTNRGYVHALNRGLQDARGELIARQDADDISMPTRLAEQVSLLDRHPRAALVGSAFHFIDEEGRQTGLRPYPLRDTGIRWHMLFGNAFAHTAVVMRSSVLHQHGLRYEPAFVPAEDYRLWSQLLSHGSGLNVESPLVAYRRHPSQVSQTCDTLQRDKACAIACDNLAAIGVVVSPVEASSLCNWVLRGLPYPLRGEDMGLGCRLLEILSAFAAQPGVDREEARRIRRAWVDRFLMAGPPAGVGQFFAHRIFRTMLRQDAPQVAGYVATRLVARCRRPRSQDCG